MVKQWIVPESDRDLAADRYYPGYKPHIIKPIEAVIIHYTGSRSPTGTRNWLTEDDDVFVSCSFILERDGVLKQLIPLDERGAHAGGKSSKLFGRSNVNGRTIGIEIMNVGPLEAHANGWWSTGKFAKRFDGPMISAGGSRPERDDDYPFTAWEAYSPKQIDGLVLGLKNLVIEFPILKSDPYKRITGHENVDPSRKMDPGPAFPWEIVRRQVFGEEITADL